MALLVGLLTGCIQTGPLGRSFTPSFRPDNIYQAEDSLPPELRRVALLPFGTRSRNTEMEFAKKTLWPVLLSQLHSSKLFEVIPVSPDELMHITGLKQWNSDQPLPSEFLESLRDTLGVQGVVIPELTVYTPYEPLAIGWRIKLIDTEEPRILWALDEVFDSSLPEVAAAARRYGAKQQAERPNGSHQPVLQSPRMFANYATSAIVSTIPGRPKLDL
jgi:hypothetical protein